jgi:hypothetical protein
LASKNQAVGPNRDHHVLFFLIPSAWLAVLALLVCVCRIAADADAAPTSGIVPSGPIGERIILSHTPVALPPDSRRPHDQREALRSRRPQRRRQAVAHAGR